MRTRTKGKEAFDSLQKEGIHVRLHPLDVDDSGSIRSVRETVDKGPGRVDILVNNAGANLDGEKTVENKDTEKIDRTIAKNVYGPLMMCQSFLPLMWCHNYRRTVKVSSTM